ncbi:MAG: hypothetical protein FWG92_02055 [Leptospirales bacterium]|nr:hypothetical protein [Leptospirales bacterium]
MRRLAFILLCFFVPCIALGKTTGKKIYITPFKVASDGKSAGSIADEVRDYMSESLVASYSLISDDEVRVFINNAEMNQLMGSGSYGSLEKLASAIKVDYLIHGEIHTGQSIRITASLIRHDGSIVNTGEISYSKPEYTDRAARALGEWLITDRKSIGGFFGKKDPREEFKKDIEKFEKSMNKIETDYVKGSASIKASSQRRDTSLSHSPRVRLGGSGFGMFTIMNDYMNKLYDPSFLVMGDLFLLRYKDPVGDGVDLYVRGTYRKFSISESAISSARQSGAYKDRIGDFMSEPGKNSWIDIYSADAGIRFVGSFYVLQSAASLYLNVASRFNYALKNPKSSGAGKTSFNQWGVIGGTGIEISLMPSIGLFTEFNIGYVPMGEDKINFEGPQLIAGITFRTNHWE